MGGAIVRIRRHLSYLEGIFKDTSESEIRMNTIQTHDCYLHFKKTFFETRRHSGNKVNDNNYIKLNNTKTRLLGRKLCNEILRTMGEILVVGLLLAIGKYSGIYEIWVQIAEKLV